MAVRVSLHRRQFLLTWLVALRTKLQADELRASVYNIETFPQELRYWAGGLSNEISSVVKTLHKIRGRVAVR